MRDTTDFSPASIKYALDNSLQRLQTDYIDLYQLYIGQNVKQIFRSKRV
jgi:aryl-alcohol dehydrogenase-like predicted oxidoreductase